MSHGSKRFIKAYDGKIKRSNDRTKKDYYRELKWWDEHHYFRWHRKYNFGKYKMPFCPQCKHVQKPIIAEEEAWRKRNDELRAEYNRIFGDAIRIWEEYHKSYWTRNDEQYLARKPKIDEPPSFWYWMKDVAPDHTHYWNYNPRSFLCYKCEHKYETKCEMYQRAPWWNPVHTETRRQEYRDYRNEVKNVMQRAKYDEELYENIPKYKRGWCD